MGRFPHFCITVWRRLPVQAGLLAGLLSGCASVNLGVSIPVGSHGGVGVSVGTDGRIGVGVGVSAGGGTVSVGTSGQLPVNKNDDTEAQP